MNPTLPFLGGKADLAIGSVVIPARFLSEITPNFVEGTRETTTLTGTTTRPSGTFETKEIMFTMYLDSMSRLKDIFPGLYTAPTGTGNGKLTFGGVTCASNVPVPVNIHYVCDEDDRNDVHVFAALPLMTFNPTYNESDALSVEVTLYAQDTEEGVYRLGAGLLNEPSLWDAATGTSVPVDE